jgi:3'-phosphoadenosine 5'-phosphosulfate sulfotransferase (PAPS reductase)/FAD synthetase
MPFDPMVSADASTPDLSSYDHIVVAFSGGKDSLACLLHLLDQGVDPARIELWHHDVDGREGSELMDWPATRGYCKAVARALGVKLYFSWKVGGFEREMLRAEARTAPIAFETPDGVRTIGGTAGKLGTRRRFPQVAADLRTRWCSAYLKIDVCAAAIRGQDRFRDSKTLVVTGERAEESSARSKYQTFEPHRCDSRDGARVRRHVDAWRPVHGWSEAKVWEIIERYGVDPHPAYKLGWGRVSCAACIFGSANQWASLQAIAPERFERVASYEDEFGVTIQRTKSVRRLAVAGQRYAQTHDQDVVRQALDADFDADVLVGKAWKLPAGAFGESCGPT